MTDHPILTRTLEHAKAFADTIPTRPVCARATAAELRESLDSALPEHGIDPLKVIDDLVHGVEPGLLVTPSPRFFGFVIGGTHPVSIAADWLTSIWDQNAGAYAVGPSASIIEEITARWVLELLDLPHDASVGFVTGCQMAHFTALAAARYEMLRRAGWDLEAKGLQGAPRMHFVVGADVHVTVYIALRYLGFGRDQVKVVPVDDQGRMIADKLPAILAECDGPTVVCVQVGNINTGASDPVDAIADHVARHKAWLHVDGAFGLWAQVSPLHRDQTKGVERADSWATDAHKWLNVPYDSGIAITRYPAAHRAAFTATADYLILSQSDTRDQFDYAPEFSQRARAIPTYALIRSLGRSGIRELVERPCRLAEQMAEQLSAHAQIEILNDVVLNQVLLRLHPKDGSDSGAFTKQVLERVQNEGTCWPSGTLWHDEYAIRISICNWMTTEEDIDLSVAAIIAAIEG